MDVNLIGGMPKTTTLDEARAVYQAAFGEVCQEIVHVAVTPDAQGRGVGRLVHDVLIAGGPAPTAILTVHPQAGPAQRLYLGRGWTVLTKEFRTHAEQPAHWVMGRAL